MSNPSRFLALLGVLLLSLCSVPIASADYVDPPGRVAFLDDALGPVSYSPAGEDEWVSIVQNRALIRGDRLWTDFGARAEFQVGSAAVRLGPFTSVQILDLNDNIAQFQITQGMFSLSLRRMYPGQVFEIDTPTLAFTIDRPGRYRIDVDPGSTATTIGVWDGAGEAHGENANFPLFAGDTVRFYSTDLRDYEMVGVPPQDDFDLYCTERDRLLASSPSLRYIDDDVAGYADLDSYGVWRPVRDYGAVWFPSQVDAGWSPYRDGHWIWQEPWGWTWVDDAPWGFAPSHYGRWAYISRRWGWVPGPRHVRPVYAPALVAFVSDSGWSMSLSIGDGAPIGWFPLGPRDVYVPPYHASRNYFTQVNVTNTVVNNTTIINVYKNYSSGSVNFNHENYANRSVAGAVTVVPRSAFVNAQPVQQAAIQIDRRTIPSAEITRLAPIAPSQRSVIGAAKPAKALPSREAFDRRVIVRNTPPPVERALAGRIQQLQKNPGQPLESGAVNSVQNPGTLPNLRLLGEQRGAIDARSAGSRRSGATTGAPANLPGQVQPMERTPRHDIAPGSISGGQIRNDANQDQGNAPQQASRQNQSVIQKLQEQRMQNPGTVQQPANLQLQQQLQRQKEIQLQEQNQRKADIERKTAEQQAEQQRRIEIQQLQQRQLQATPQQQEQRQIQNLPPTQVQRQIQAIPQQQEQRLRQTAPQQLEQRQVVKQQGQTVKTPQELQAECERQAILQHRDPQQCRSKAQPQTNPDNPNKDKIRR